MQSNLLEVVEEKQEEDQSERERLSAQPSPVDTQSGHSERNFVVTGPWSAVVEDHSRRQDDLALKMMAREKLMYLQQGWQLQQ